jgi:L-cysteine/cystine lyase
VVSHFPADAERVDALRDAIPATGAGIYLNTGSAGPLPAETAHAMAEAAELELRLGRAHTAHFEQLHGWLDEARAGIAAVIGADVDEIAITRATSDGMSIASWATDWRPGDRIVTTTLEHPGALGPLYQLRDRLAVELVHVEIGDGGDHEAILRGFDAAITPSTRLVSVSHVSWATGAILPITEIAEIAHARGALVAVDGAQSAGAIPLRVPDLGVDTYAVPGQKWLLGPEGTGALWVAPSAMHRLGVTFAGYPSFERIDSRGTAALHADARRFDLPGFHPPSVLGLARSVGWLAMFVGLDWLYRRAGSLAASIAERLAATPGVELVTPPEHMGTLVTFRIAGWSPDAAAAELQARTFAILRTLPLVDGLRISVGFFNTEAELARFADAVELLAAHTPETIPPRRTLTLLGETE